MIQVRRPNCFFMLVVWFMHKGEGDYCSSTFVSDVTFSLWLSCCSQYDCLSIVFFCFWLLEIRELFIVHFFLFTEDLLSPFMIFMGNFSLFIWFFVDKKTYVKHAYWRICTSHWMLRCKATDRSICLCSFRDLINLSSSFLGNLCDLCLFSSWKMIFTPPFLINALPLLSSSEFCL